ncbi:hypothetical protein RISK_003712 [Rhodopirellula islandica]|uniref:Uncharacterized protein n=1 Tax=Rhodopirellula islandica TaxID=595434 RepID=A0A0J1BC91_RHOIS|nr:hypothetical protein RISK_003712 [Rhodopirellula islandica]
MSQAPPTVSNCLAAVAEHRADVHAYQSDPDDSIAFKTNAF